MRFLVIITLICIIICSCKESPSTNKDSSVESSKTTKETRKKNQILSHKKWAKNQGMTNVESVVYDDLLDRYYVSCGDKYVVGHDGFITSISGTGELVELKWIDSLSRPTGMAIYKRHLYAADVDHLVMIDIDSGEILKKFKEPVDNSGLNDVAITNDGEVFVTASAKHSVYKLQEGELKEWVADEDQLKWANGIYTSDDQILVGGMKLVAIDLNSGVITSVNYPSGLSDFEGIGSDGLGGYFVTTVENSSLWHISKHGDANRLQKGQDYFGDFQVLSPNQLVLARGNHEKGEYYLSYIELAKSEK